MILDEATNALDRSAETKIQAALQDKTVIAIAHRLSTIAELVRIIMTIPCVDSGSTLTVSMGADSLLADSNRANIGSALDIFLVIDEDLSRVVRGAVPF